MGTISHLHFAARQRRKAQRRFPIVICLILSATWQISGCTISPFNPGRTETPPVDAFSRAELSLRTAAEARADELAPMDLQRAKEKLEQARRAMAARKNDDARRLAEAAEIEAELAEAKAEAEIIRLAAEQLRLRSDALRQEIEGAARRGSPTETSKGK